MDKEEQLSKKVGALERKAYHVIRCFVAFEDRIEMSGHKTLSEAVRTIINDTEDTINHLVYKWKL